MKLHLALTLLIASPILLLGQHSLGLKASGGFSCISNDASSENLKLTIQFAPSIQAGLFYALRLGKHSALGADLVINQIGGKEQLEVNFIDPSGNYIGNGTSQLTKQITYLSLPVYYGFRMNRLTFNLGIQGSLALLSIGKNKGKNLINGIESSFENQYSSINIDRFDFGPRAGILYQLTDKLQLEGMYYYGLNNIFGPNGPGWTWRVQQAIIGVRYTFGSHDQL